MSYTPDGRIGTMPATDSTPSPSPRARFGTLRFLRAGDILAGLTLAAIAIPEQMATARLGHFPPALGFLAFIAGTAGFLLIGASRVVSVGADSTITPIFAGSLALIASVGSPAYLTLGVFLAVMVGILVAFAGVFRMGWVSNLLSVPVTTGFLAGISAHILASQLPALCGIAPASGEAAEKLIALARHLNQTNPWSAALGLGVLAIIAGTEKFDRRWPGALIGVAAATIATLSFALERRGVSVIGTIAPPTPRLPQTWPAAAAIVQLVPLAVIIALVVMVQSAATTRAFPPDGGTAPDIDRDFLGVGLGNILAGFVGAFAVNASPPRTAVAAEAGAQSKLAGLVAALSVAALAWFGSSLLSHIPGAALAGVLLFVAIRILRVRQARDIWRESKPEFLLVAATFLAIVVLPIQNGVAIGILLSLLHGMWTTTRAQVIALGRVPGSTVWWPRVGPTAAQEILDVLVLSFHAPLSFLNAEAFRHGFLHEIDRRRPLRLVVLESNGIVDIDFTAAHVLADIIQTCRDRKIDFALARLESVRAQGSFERFGLDELIGRACVFRSVQEAIDTLALAQGKGPSTV